MTINELISQLRESLKSRVDDSNFSDQYFYDLIKGYRATLLKRRAEKYRALSRFNYQKFCVPLETVSESDCVDCNDCAKNLNCNILRSTKKLPTALNSRNTDVIKVRTIGGDQLSSVSDFSEYKSLQYSKTRKNKKVYSIVNGYLEVYNTDLLRFVIVEGVLEDPTALVDWNTCGSSNTDTCYDIQQDDFPLEESMFPIIKDMIFKELNLTIQLPEDERNDSRPQNTI